MRQSERDCVKGTESRKDRPVVAWWAMTCGSRADGEEEGHCTEGQHGRGP